MLVKASELVGKKLKHTETGETYPEINEILFNVYDHKLCYVTYQMEVPASSQDGINTREEDRLQTIMAATAVAGTPNAPVTAGTYHQEIPEYQAETFYLPWHQLLQVTDDEVLFTGNDMQLSEPAECYGFNVLKGWHVIKKDGTEIGKIHDALIDWSDRKLVGFSVHEGLLKQLFGEGKSEIRLTGKPDNINEKWILDGEPEEIE